MDLENISFVGTTQAMEVVNGIKAIVSGVEQSFFFEEAEALLNELEKAGVSVVTLRKSITKRKPGRLKVTVRSAGERNEFEMVAAPASR
jgi:hypothetical protein